MKKLQISFLTILIFAFCCVGMSAQTVFDDSKLSEEGRGAYEKLLSAGKFALGGVGEAGTLSGEERGLQILVRESFAEEACLSLAANAGYEGGLYGLLGLSFLQSAAYPKALEIYKSRPTPPERVIGERRHVGPGQIITMRGCLITRTELTEILAKIENGSLVKEFEANRETLKVSGQ